jgi:hypothetical protein
MIKVVDGRGRGLLQGIILSRIGCNHRRGLDWMIGFIALIHSQLVTTINYSAIVNLHTLQFTVTQTLRSESSLVVSWQRISTQ